MSTQALELIEQAPREVTHAAPSTVATPAMLLQIAVQQGADLDKLERLMALQERYEASEARKAYNEAFSRFKAAAVRLVKNKQVTAGPLSGKTYAELHSVVNAVTPELSANGLSASWRITKDDREWIEVTCTLSHVLGHSESVSMGGPPDTGGAKNGIQARASTVSYLERYTLKAILGLSEQDDDNDAGHSNEWTAQIDGTKDEAELNSLVRKANAHFNKTRDAKGLGAFMIAATTHRAFLKQVAQQEQSGG